MSDEGQRGDGRLTHVDERGRAFMVDVTGKDSTERRAVAAALVMGATDVVVRFGPGGPDADALSAARAAGIGAAKATSELIPLCHPLPLTDLSVDFALSNGAIEVRATAATVGQTGVEMEALTACALAALSLVSHLGPAASTVSLDALTLLEKRGGRSGSWLRADGPAQPTGAEVEENGRSPADPAR